MRCYAIDPATCFTTALIEVKGDIKIRLPTFLLAASQVAGPVPIDLPIIMIFLWLKFNF